MKKELDILLADMATGNHRLAMSSFKARINSNMLSQLVDGMIGIDHGDDMRAYFQGLELKFREFEVERLKREAKKRPDEFTFANVLIVISITALFLSVMIMQIIQTLQTSFGA